MYSINTATVKIMSCVFPSWTISPFTQVRPQVLRIGNLIPGDDPRAHRAEAIHALGKGGLRRRDVKLEFARAHIVENGVAGNRLHRIVEGRVFRERTDDYRELDFVIQLGNSMRPNDH